MPTTLALGDRGRGGRAELRAAPIELSLRSMSGDETPHQATSCASCAPADRNPQRAFFLLRLRKPRALGVLNAVASKGERLRKVRQ
jgi:hypothetical protein